MLAHRPCAARSVSVAGSQWLRATSGIRRGASRCDLGREGWNPQHRPVHILVDRALAPNEGGSHPLWAAGED